MIRKVILDLVFTVGTAMFVITVPTTVYLLFVVGIVGFAFGVPMCLVAVCLMEVTMHYDEKWYPHIEEVKH